MFSNPTVFVLGAGASKEVGLPTGDQLKDQIATAVRFRFQHGQRTKGDEELLRFLRQRFSTDINTYTRAGNELAEIIPTFISIDEALHYFGDRKEVVALGKLSIVQSILRAEAKSDLSANSAGRIDLSRVAKSWMPQFLSMLLAATQRADLATAFQNLSIVNFNYDRTLEHYLYYALQAQAGVDANTAASLVGKMRVFRPYGSIGDLEWQGNRGTAFGQDVRDEIFSLADSIRTYTEQYSSDLHLLVSQALDRANLVVFLGFGFHQQNMKWFEPLIPRGSGRSVFATVSGIDGENFPVLRTSLRHFFGTEPRLLDRFAGPFLASLRPSILAAAN